MGESSKIEWTDASWTPIRARNLLTNKIGWHCEHSTTGCEFCYAEGMNKRLGTGLPFKPGHRKDIELFLDENTLAAPLRWRRPRMIFVCSMTDLFAEFVPDEWIDRVFAVMALCPQHTFQILTKRAERMRDYYASGGRNARAGLVLGRAWEMLGHPPLRKYKHGGIQDRPWPLPNLWLGVSAERQEEYDERWPLLRSTPAAIRFVSYEPALGPLKLIPFPHRLAEPGPLFPDWLICGGESGPNARPMHPQWPRDIRDQCKDHGIAFFYKQTGEWIAETVQGTSVDLTRLPNNQAIAWGDGKSNHTRYTRVGKKAAGRSLDGREWNEMPQTSAAVR